jgi:hypothetical protein
MSFLNSEKVVVLASWGGHEESERIQGRRGHEDRTGSADGDLMMHASSPLCLMHVFS